MFTDQKNSANKFNTIKICLLKHICILSPQCIFNIKDKELNTTNRSDGVRLYRSYLYYPAHYSLIFPFWLVWPSLDLSPEIVKSKSLNVALRQVTYLPWVKYFSSDISTEKLTEHFWRDFRWSEMIYRESSPWFYLS